MVSSTWQRQLNGVEMSFTNVEPTLKSIRPQPSSGPVKSVITADPTKASPAWRREANLKSFRSIDCPERPQDP